MSDTPDLQSMPELIRFEGREEAIPLVLSLAQKAKRQICILGPDIDSVLFDTPEFIECLRQFSVSTSRAQIKIIASKTKLNVQRGHRIIPLAQHLTSSIHVREPDPQHKNIQHILFLVDDFAYFKCPRATRYEGTASTYNRFEVQRLQSEFDEVWQHSAANMSIRRFHI